jgi:hypothetical protein
MFNRLRKRIFLALIEVLNPYPGEREFEEEIFNFIMKLLPLYPFLVRVALFAGLFFLELYPVFSLKSVKPFSFTGYEKKLSIIEEMLQKKPGIRRNLARAFKALVQMAFYEHPWYMKKAGYSWAL